MNSKYQLKEENFRKTITIKQRSTSTTYSLWNLTPQMSEFLYNNGYEHLFNVLTEETIISKENNDVLMNDVVPVEEEIVPLEVLVKPKRKTKRK
jgi:hypothetical protein